MDRKRSSYTQRTRDAKELRAENKKATGDCDTSSTSHTHFFKKKRDGNFTRITSSEYLGLSESSASSDTFQCVHGHEGKKISERKLKQSLLRGLDSVPVDTNWEDKCPPLGWDVAKTLEFLVKDPVGCENIDRIQSHIDDFVTISQGGYRIDTLHSFCSILDYLIEVLPKQPILREHLIQLLKNTEKPILLTASSDVVTQFEHIKNYLGYLGYLLIRTEDNDIFDLVSQALIWQLSAPDSSRGHGAKRRYALAAGAPVLRQTVVRMLALASPHKFPRYLNIAFVLACDSSNNCMEMIHENILENILSRFNPFYPEPLPPYETTPSDTGDINLKLGASSVHMSTTLSLLLVLLKTLKCTFDEDPKCLASMPPPDLYALRCFIWAYRFECRAQHRHERTALTVIASVLLKCYGERVMAFSTLLMPDVMTLSVHTEVPPRRNWTRSVIFTTGQMDVQFKKLLIYLSVDFLKVFPFNRFMVESQLWLLGLMYLLDPCLDSLRARWAPSLLEEIRKVAFQALVCVLPYISPKLVSEYGLIRRFGILFNMFHFFSMNVEMMKTYLPRKSYFDKRTMWYIEWYTENPYELPVLYWCVRLIQASTYQPEQPQRNASLLEFYQTYGVVIITNLCYTLLKQKQPPVEKSQVIISICLTILSNVAALTNEISCCVYPHVRWPDTIYSLAWTMLETILSSLENNLIISDRWIISSLNLIWASIERKTLNRDAFISNSGVYNLLDLITISKAPVQCICLAMLCDIAASGGGVSQLVSWRAKPCANYAYPKVVQRGATIMTLLASVFRDECLATGVQLDSNGVIENLDNPLMSKLVKEEMMSPDFEDKTEKASVCLAAADLCGSRMSKAFCLLYLLSEDLAQKVSLADEAYNLYKNLYIKPKDEVILVLCSNYLTLKLNETWSELKDQCPKLLSVDDQTVSEFLGLNEGWCKEIQKHQNRVLQRDRNKRLEEENSLYVFLSRIRLNVALDALRDVRCAARSSDRSHAMHAMAMAAERTRCTCIPGLECGIPVIRTYTPPLDEQNTTGQYVRIANDKKEKI